MLFKFKSLTNALLSQQCISRPRNVHFQKNWWNLKRNKYVKDITQTTQIALQWHSLTSIVSVVFPGNFTPKIWLEKGKVWSSFEEVSRYLNPNIWLVKSEDSGLPLRKCYKWVVSTLLVLLPNINEPPFFYLVRRNSVGCFSIYVNYFLFNNALKEKSLFLEKRF